MPCSDLEEGREIGFWNSGLQRLVYNANTMHIKHKQKSTELQTVGTQAEIKPNVSTVL